MSAELVLWHTDVGQFPAVIVSRGRKRLHLITMFSGVGTRAVPLSEERYMTPLLHNGRPYPKTRLKRQLRNRGRTLGISITAKRAVSKI